MITRNEWKVMTQSTVLIKENLKNTLQNIMMYLSNTDIQLYHEGLNQLTKGGIHIHD